MAKWASVKVVSVAFSPATVPPGSSEQLFTVPGVRLGDFVAANKPTPQSGLGLGGARASANDQIGLTFTNDTQSPINPTPGEFYTILDVTPRPDHHKEKCCDDRDSDRDSWSDDEDDDE